MSPRIVVFMGFLAVGLMIGAACGKHAMPTPEPTPTPTVMAGPAVAATVEEVELTEHEKALINAFSFEFPWETNFKKHSVPYSEFMSGGPPPNGIPPIYEPKFILVAEVDWLEAMEPVVALEVGRDARAYPMQVLIWHEIVNDVVGGVPAAVTFCPLCNLALAFDRRVGKEVLDFGTTGLLRYSDLVMWDTQTHSWWQQAMGEAVVGEYTGTRLSQLPAAIVPWQDFAQAYPQGKVLSRDTGFQRPYGQNPYVGYDRADEPWLFIGPEDNRLHPMERIVALKIGGQDVAYPFSYLAQSPVVHDQVGGQPLVVFYQPGARSALDQGDIARSRAVGAAAAYDSVLEGRRLTFRAVPEGFVDEQTGTLWNLLGQGLEGPLAGKGLRPIPHGTHFWFAWAAFVPGARVYGLEPK